MTRRGVLSILSLASAASATQLDNLSTREAISLLQEWNLARPFAKGFVEQDYDGWSLRALADLDLSVATASLKRHFPDADALQWRKLQMRVQSVLESGGEVEVDAADVVLPGTGEHASASVGASGGAGAGAGAGATRRRLADTEYSGIAIKRDTAQVALGVNGDVTLKRGTDGTLTIASDSLLVTSSRVEITTADFVANGTDVVGGIVGLQADSEARIADIRDLNEEVEALSDALGLICSATNESSYSCDNLTPDWGGDYECVEDVGTLQLAWTDRTYEFEGAPDNILDTFHTYAKVELDGTPPCSTEGGYSGNLAEDAIVAICCANHGSYTDAGNNPYASVSGEGYSNAIGLDWLEHGDEWSLSNHDGTPCTFFEAYVEAGDYTFCCSEGWATGIFVSTPPLTCSESTLAEDVEALQADSEARIADIRVLKEEMYYLNEVVLNGTCTSTEETDYACENLTPDWGGDYECIDDVTTLQEAWTDRTYQFEEAPDNLLDTFHTYMKVELDGTPPCSTEGGYSGNLAEDAIVAICCANHGSYTDAGNNPYASVSGEGYSNAIGLDWLEHGDEWSLSNHDGTPCTFFEAYVEAGDYMFCCSEGWATGIFVSTPPLDCDDATLANDVEDNTDDISALYDEIRTLKEEISILQETVGLACSLVEGDESDYPCDDISAEWGGDYSCIEDVGSGQDIWTDRTYAFEDAPDNLLNTFHTYVQPELDGGPPCSTEGGFYGELAEDAIVGICCANHGSYSSNGNQPYATTGSEGYSSYRLGLDWTAHASEWSISNHNGSPCSFFETYVEAGTYLFCCSEGWATGIFVSTPPVTCSVS